MCYYLLVGVYKMVAKAAIPLIASMAMGAVSSVAGGISQAQQAKQEASLQQQNVDASKYNIRATQAQQQLERSRTTQELARRRGSLNVSSATSGLGGTTNSDIAWESAINAETDLLNMEKGFSTNMFNLESQLSSAKYAKKTAKGGIGSSLFGTLLNTGASIAGGMSSYKQLSSMKA